MVHTMMFCKYSMRTKVISNIFSVKSNLHSFNLAFATAVNINLGRIRYVHVGYGTYSRMRTK